MTATLNPAWRLILRLLLAVVCVELCSCQKVSHTSNLEGNHAALPVPRSSDSVPKGTEQATANNPDSVGDVIEVREPTTTTSTRRSGGDVLSGVSIVVPEVVSGNGNGETRTTISIRLPKTPRNLAKLQKTRSLALQLTMRSKDHCRTSKAANGVQALTTLWPT
uniref:Putative proclotting enzyme n=1 Tax=Ixodes ricinus TaxID=34613 RepID=A0A0K8R3T4_IXORI